MPLETGTYISDLVATNPTATDAVSVGDDHIRLVKSTIKATFPNFTAVALASTQAQLDAAAVAIGSGAISFAAGTAALPKLNVLGDTTTGLYSAGAGKLDVTTAGVQRAEWSSAGLSVNAAITAGTGITVTSGGLTVTAGGLTVTAGGITVSAGDVNIVSGALKYNGVAKFPVVTADITNAAVTYAKIQNASAATLLGNPTGLAAALGEITLGTGLAFAGTVLNGTLAPVAPNLQILTSGSALTYTTPTSNGNLPLYLRVRMVGGGAGGGATNTNNGTDGGDTSFGSWTAIHGVKGLTGSSGGAGGSGGVNGTGTQVRRINGSNGLGMIVGSGTQNNATLGGISAFGGPGANTNTGNGSSGASASPNSGSGGAGAGSAGGGGAGEYVEFIVTSPAASYVYTVGAQGNGGAAGGNAGGNGAAGRIEVEAHWQ
jgi:hypothetical protein